MLLILQSSRLEPARGALLLVLAYGLGSLLHSAAAKPRESFALFGQFDEIRACGKTLPLFTWILGALLVAVAVLSFFYGEDVAAVMPAIPWWLSLASALLWIAYGTRRMQAAMAGNQKGQANTITNSCTAQQIEGLKVLVYVAAGALATVVAISFWPPQNAVLGWLPVAHGWSMFLLTSVFLLGCHEFRGADISLRRLSFVAAGWAALTLLSLLSSAMTGNHFVVEVLVAVPVAVCSFCLSRTAFDLSGANLDLVTCLCLPVAAVLWLAQTLLEVFFSAWWKLLLLAWCGFGLLTYYVGYWLTNRVQKWLGPWVLFALLFCALCSTVRGCCGADDGETKKRAGDWTAAELADAKLTAEQVSKEERRRNDGSSLLNCMVITLYAFAAFYAYSYSNFAQWVVRYGGAWLVFFIGTVAFACCCGCVYQAEYRDKEKLAAHTKQAKELKEKAEKEAKRQKDEAAAKHEATIAKRLAQPSAVAATRINRRERRAKDGWARLYIKLCANPGDGRERLQLGFRALAAGQLLLRPPQKQCASAPLSEEEQKDLQALKASVAAGSITAEQRLRMKALQVQPCPELKSLLFSFYAKYCVARLDEDGNRLDVTADGQIEGSHEHVAAMVENYHGRQEVLEALLRAKYQHGIFADPDPVSPVLEPDSEPSTLAAAVSTPPPSPDRGAGVGGGGGGVRSRLFGTPKSSGKNRESRKERKAREKEEKAQRERELTEEQAAITAAAALQAEDAKAAEGAQGAAEPEAPEEATLLALDETGKQGQHPAVLPPTASDLMNTGVTPRPSADAEAEAPEAKSDAAQKDSSK